MSDIEDTAKKIRLEMERSGKVKPGFPESAEGYNYLAAAEMSSEDNYDMIDGIPNNGFKRREDEKPSIIEQLRSYKPKPTERTGRPDKPDRYNALDL